MNKLRYTGILYFISAVILATLCIQIYWNYKNYHIARQQLINDVQTSLDNAVDSYYTNLAKEQTVLLMRDSSQFKAHDRVFLKSIMGDSLPKRGKVTLEMESVPERYASWISPRSNINDSNSLSVTVLDTIKKKFDSTVFQSFSDSLKYPIEQLSSKIYISFTEESLSLDRIDSLLARELDRKQINIDYGLVHTGFLQKKDSLRPELVDANYLNTSTSSPYFVYNSSLEIFFRNITLTLLKRNLLGILLSFLLVTGVVLCLLYLLRIIRQQKQLAEVKNDLISNITHEFKTPIATIGVAMEGIESFKNDQDPEKPLRYARISREQVEKLNAMVEKLLETATLDSENLRLELEECDLASLLEKCLHSENVFQSGKDISFTAKQKKIIAKVDVFHMENALNNIIDNAVKYGGEQIRVSISAESGNIVIQISDSGNSLTPQQGKQIFEKFYRVPRGNTHDVKGFGIGLYYTRKIIERHGGSVRLDLSNNTSFIVSLPNG